MCSTTWIPTGGTTGGIPRGFSKGVVQEVAKVCHPVGVHQGGRRGGDHNGCQPGVVRQESQGRVQHVWSAMCGRTRGPKRWSTRVPTTVVPQGSSQGGHSRGYRSWVPTWGSCGGVLSVGSSRWPHVGTSVFPLAGSHVAVQQWGESRRVPEGGSLRGFFQWGPPDRVPQGVTSTGVQRRERTILVRKGRPPIGVPKSGFIRGVPQG